MEHPINKDQVKSLYKAIKDNYKIVKDHGCEIEDHLHFMQVVIGKAAGLGFAEIFKLKEEVQNG